MAKKLKTPPVEVKDDLSVLLSTRDINIAGKSLTVREFTLMDSLVLNDALAPVINSLTDVMQTADPSFDDVQQVLVKHADVLPLLMARCVEQPVEWVATLPGSEGIALMDWWWTVNQRFFMRAAARQMTIRTVGARQSGLAASSPSSSAQDTTQTG